MRAQLQEIKDRKTPAATTWAAKFLLRVGESSEFLGLWINSGSIHEAKRRRVTQVITCSFPCGKWLHMIGARASPRCELCRRERRHGQEAIERLPEETVAHIQSAGCKAEKKSVIGAHNRCWRYLLCAITKGGDTYIRIHWGRQTQVAGVIVERHEHRKRLTMGGFCG